MKLTGIVFIILGLLICPQKVAESSSVIIAAEDAADPWSKKNGTGYANDVVREAFEAVGIEVQFDVVPYARCKDMVQRGQVVACFSMSPEPGLEKTVTLSDEPLFNVYFDYFQNKKKPLSAKLEKDIHPGTVIGIVHDYEYPESAMKLKAKGVVFEEVNDEITNLKKLAHGRIDATIINHNETKPASDMIARAGVKGRVEFAFRGSTMGSYLGFSKIHPDSEVMRMKFNEGYRIIHRNGTVKRIERRWIPLDIM